VMDAEAVRLSLSLSLSLILRCNAPLDQSSPVDRC